MRNRRNIEPSQEDEFYIPLERRPGLRRAADTAITAALAVGSAATVGVVVEKFVDNYAVSGIVGAGSGVLMAYGFRKQNSG